jgi:chemotaxis protein methyltransferase CheR
MLQMTQEEYELMDEFLARHFGLTFPEHKREILESRLRPRLSALRLKSFYDYYLLLQYDSGDSREIRTLAQAITNNETYFFRETGQFDAFFSDALPELEREHSTDKTFRLLSVGCSSGEEPYTLNIWAKENQYRMWGFSFQIDAFDIDESRIEVARNGVYGPSSFRGVTPEQMQKYFVQANGSGLHAVRPLFRSGIGFEVGNLVRRESYRRLGAYDAIFCRNVLIYFSEATLRRAVENFAAALHPGGYLFLGHSESIIGLSSMFEPLRVGDTIAYRRAAS